MNYLTEGKIACVLSVRSICSILALRRESTLEVRYCIYRDMPPHRRHLLPIVIVNTAFLPRVSITKNALKMCF